MKWSTVQTMLTRSWYVKPPKVLSRIRPSHSVLFCVILQDCGSLYARFGARLTPRMQDVLHSNFLNSQIPKSLLCHQRAFLSKGAFSVQPAGLITFFMIGPVRVLPRQSLATIVRYQIARRRSTPRKRLRNAQLSLQKMVPKNRNLRSES